MKLQEDSIRWAITHILKESDNDLFPRPFELNVIKDAKEEIINTIKEIDIGSYRWNSARRFLVPKDATAFRNATQLDIFDSIIFASIIREFGHLIEQVRIPEIDNIVFSYRFHPQIDGTLYSNKKAWENFYTKSKNLAPSYSHIVICDISDFYNQINLHTIENQLINCGLPNQINKSIKELIISITQRSSKGIPIGPHGSHLLAEMSLIPFDDNLKLQNIEFKRYVDDIIVFCESEKDARIKLNKVAEILDKEQRLILQKQKTKIITSHNFIEICKQNLLEQPINPIEADILEVINDYTSGDAYSKIQLSELSNEDLKSLSKENIEELFDSYLQNDSPNYERIRWLYRRLAQIGIPTAIEYSIKNFYELIPALNDVCLYINSCATNYTSNWSSLGEKIILLLDDEMIESNEFYKISLLNLFIYNQGLNNIDKLIKIFNNASGNLKRKIILSAINYNSSGWLRTLKESYNTFDNWTKRAYLIALHKLPKEEREFFFKGAITSLSDSNYFEKIIMKWSKSK